MMGVIFDRGQIKGFFSRSRILIWQAKARQERLQPGLSSFFTEIIRSLVPRDLKDGTLSLLSVESFPVDAGAFSQTYQGGPDRREDRGALPGNLCIRGP